MDGAKRGLPFSRVSCIITKLEQKQIGDVLIMQKKSLLALLLVLSLLLSGCALVTVDEAKDMARTIIDVNGETINKQTFINAVNNTISQNSYYNQLYAQLGMSAQYSTDTATVMQEVADQYVNSLAAMQKARELGMYEFTDEEKAHVQEHAKEDYDSYVQQVISANFSDSELEGDALREAAEAYIKENGLATLEDFTKSAEDEVAMEKLQDYVVADVEVTDDEVTASLTERAESAKAQYESNPEAYGVNVNNGSTVYYAPAGYRMVKQILIGFSDEEKAAISDAETALTDAQAALADAQAAVDGAAEDADKDALSAAVAQAQAAVDEAQAKTDEARAAALAAAKTKADEVYALATAEGADFDALIQEYNEDTGMPENGYAVREGYSAFVESFTNAAMALEKVGDVSAPTESTYGYHIIRYAADVAEGTVDTEAVRETIKSGLLTTKQNEKISAAMAEWVGAAAVKTYLDRAN